MCLYVYSGPVLYYDKVIANNWKSETRAPSKQKAASNFKYQFKNYSNMIGSAGGITLAGAIKEKEN